MAQETVACLQDQGLEVIVDLEHAMDAACGRQEFGAPCDTEFAAHARSTTSTRWSSSARGSG